MKGLAVELGRRNDPGVGTGISVAAMAKQMHRSMAAVRNRAARLKIVVAKSRNQGLGLKAKGR